MPVTFKVAPHTANTANNVADIKSIGLLRWCSYEQFDVCEELLQSFIGRGPDAIASNLMGAEGGLVSTVLTAYNSHHALVLRPDDVWLAILVQFSFYVNAHADELRDKFVAHEDKKELVVDDFGTRYTVDHGLMARRMTEEMDKFIVDQAFKDWILPRFSTTTSNDVVVASVVMMATLKEYFIYKSEIWCGIPQVTLEGEKSDWEEILRRAEKLKDYGNDVVSWYALLEPVLTRIVSTFDAPESHENADFWRRIVHYSYEGSGTRYLSGWLTAFCAFDAKGKWLGVSPENTNDIEAVKYDPKAEEFLTLDGARYFSINTSNITVGHTTVDVLLIDNGSEFKTQMVAGLVATRVSDSGDTSLSENGIKDTVSPVPGWWIFVRRSKGIMQAANEKQRAKIEAMYARWDAESAAKSESETTAHE